jgi:hypothetical protein
MAEYRRQLRDCRNDRDKSIRLALIILELANTGTRELDEIKSDALAIMLLGETVTQTLH